MTEIRVMDNECWVCGNNNSLTVHHGIPQHLRPKQNITIPICSSCHGKINNNDVTGMYSYAYRLERLSKETRNGITKLASHLEKYLKGDDNNEGNKEKRRMS